MPSYTYQCDSCVDYFEIVCSIKDYKSKVKCPKCGSSDTYRSYIDDLGSLNCSVKKADCELKTLGDLANRNRDRMSEDQKNSLHQKHNSYKDKQPVKELPSGMSRIQKPQYKTKWS